MMDERYLIDVPIYRVSEQVFHSGYTIAKDTHLAEMMQMSGVTPGQRPDWEMGVEQCFWEQYGMPWRFNQVVGYLRVFRFGWQLRGDEWRLNAKRYVRRPAHKRFYLVGKAFEIWVTQDETTESIQASLHAQLDQFSKDIRSRKWVLDRECLINLSPFVNWRALMSAP